MERKKTCNDKDDDEEEEEDDDDDDDDNDDKDDKDDDDYDDDDGDDDNNLNEPNLGPCRINISGTSWVHPLLLDYNNFQSPTLPLHQLKAYLMFHKISPPLYPLDHFSIMWI